MEQKVREIYNEFDNRRKFYEAKMADNDDLKELENLINNKNKK